MLRSHTSASIPSLLRALDPAGSTDELWAIPRLVYRRDSIDRTHVGTPHQVDLWRVSSRADLNVGDLQNMIASLVEAVLPGAQWRAVPAAHRLVGRAHGAQMEYGDILLDLLTLGDYSGQYASGDAA
jgi:phenylalanyl-tRNA synthetase alpha chain